MAENKEKTEAELLQEAMQNLGLEEVVEENGKKEELLEEVGSSNKLTDEDIESLLSNDDDAEKETVEIKDVVTEISNDDEISAVDDINLSNTSKMSENISDDLELDNDTPIQKKQSKVVKLLTIVISILLTLVSIGAVLYFLGFFDPEPIKEVKVAEEVKAPQKEEYAFNPTDIDSNRLNKKLNLLTKYEIVENSAMESEKTAEKERLYLEAKRQLEQEREEQINKIKEAERKRMEDMLPPVQQQETVSVNIDKEIEKVIDKDETKVDTKKEEVAPLVVENNEPVKEIEKTENTTQNTETIVEEEKKVEEPQTVAVPNNEPVVENSTQQQIDTPKEIVEEKPKLNQFVKVIKIATKTKDIYKSYLDKIYSISNDITLCRDYKNNIEIFIGPFEDDLNREKIAQEYLLKYNIKVEIYDYTTEEYNKRCNY